MGCGASHFDNDLILRPRLGRDAVAPVLRAFEQAGVPTDVAVQTLEDAKLLPGTRTDLWKGAGLLGEPPNSLPREEIVRIVGSCASL